MPYWEAGNLLRRRKLASTAAPAVYSLFKNATSAVHPTKSLGVQRLGRCPLRREPLGVYFLRAGVREAFRAAPDCGMGSAFQMSGMSDQAATATRGSGAQFAICKSKHESRLHLEWRSSHTPIR